MKVQESGALHAIALPAVLGAVLLSSAGAEPPPQAARKALPVRVAPMVAEFGQVVTVNGTAHGSQRGSRVRVTFTNASGVARLIGFAKLSRAYAWQLRFKATTPGRISASIQTEYTGLTPAFGAGASAEPVAIRVRPRLATSEQTTTRALSGSIKPAGRFPIRVEYRVHGHWRFGTTLRTNLQGRFRGRVALRARSVLLKLSVGAANGFAASHARYVRSLTLRPALASWYGDYGFPVACGGRLGASQMGVANKTLPCGTRVTISYHGRTVTVPVIDRGPYVAGREYDLTGATAHALHFDGVDTVMVSH